MTKKPQPKTKPQPKKKSVTAPSSTAPIAFMDLFAKIGSGQISEAEVAGYFFVTGPAPGDFIPGLAINTETVDVSGAEQLAQDIGNNLGFKAVEAVRQQNLVDSGAPAPNGTIIAEGDSWFNLPEFGFPLNIPPTLVDVLAQRNPINNIAHWGDTLSDIVNIAEYRSYLKTGKVEFFLFSGGGNDVLGGGNLANFLHQRQSGDNDPKNAPRYINPLFSRKLDEVMLLYRLLIDNVRQLSPKTTTLIHGYDFALPVLHGPWLGTALASKGFNPEFNKAISRAIIAVMLTHFNERLEALASQSGGRVLYVGLLGMVKNAWWDELHPDKNAVKRLAERFDAVLP